MLVACTSAGCGASLPSTGHTLQASPTGTNTQEVSRPISSWPSTGLTYLSHRSAKNATSAAIVCDIHTQTAKTQFFGLGK